MKTFDRHGNEAYNESMPWCNWCKCYHHFTAEHIQKDKRSDLLGQWPIGTWLQKRLLHLRLSDAADGLGMKGFIIACREEKDNED